MEPHVNGLEVDATNLGGPLQDPEVELTFGIYIGVRALLGRTADIIGTELVEETHKMLKREGMQSSPRQLRALAGRRKRQLRQRYILLRFSVSGDVDSTRRVADLMSDLIAGLERRHSAVNEADLVVDNARVPQRGYGFFDALVDIAFTGGLPREEESVAKGA